MPRYVLATLPPCTIRWGGRIDAVISNLRVFEGNRPSSADEIEGCHSNVLEDLAQRRRPPLTSTVARLGVGTALVVPDITKLAWASERAMGNLRTKVPTLFDTDGKLHQHPGLIGLFRDGGAGGTTWCTDVCSGILEGPNLLASAYCEAVEAGFHFLAEGRTTHIGRLVVPPDGNNVQKGMDAARDEEWHRLLGNTDLHCIDIPTGPVTGQSNLDTVTYDDVRHSCDISTEPCGSVEIVFPVMLSLPAVPGGWRVRDTEHRLTLNGPVPLNRRPTLIVPLWGESPVLLGLGPEGLDPNASIIYLEGSNLEMAINAKTRGVVQALGWLAA